MSTVQTEIAAIEERLRLAEFGPDPQFFEEALAGDAVLVSDDGMTFTKRQIVEAHQPGKTPRFTRVEMSGMNIVDHGTAAVVTCRGIYESPESSVTAPVHAGVAEDRRGLEDYCRFGFEVIHCSSRQCRLGASYTAVWRRSHRPC